MNCDRIAPWYKWLERGAFGTNLERCRTAQLDAIAGSRKVLMIGEGDGRFLKAFAERNAESEIDYVDFSASMLEIARRRISANDRSRIRFHRRDVIAEGPPDGEYDLIVTHFFLDCLNGAQVEALVSHLSEEATPECRWVVSEFQRPPEWPRLGGGILWVLYQFFRWTTGLRVRSLPEYRSALQHVGCFQSEIHQEFLGGLLVSELWSRRSG